MQDRSPNFKSLEGYFFIIFSAPWLPSIAPTSNPTLFLAVITPKTQTPNGEVLKQIKKDFKTLTIFKNKFEEVARERFGSGWVWLVLTKRNKLKIVSTPNQDNPLMNVVEDGGYPILGLDLWEHAYYLKYKNKRDEYISNFWKVVNWDFVSKLYEMKTETKLLESVQFKKAGETRYLDYFDPANIRDTIMLFI